MGEVTSAVPRLVRAGWWRWHVVWCRRSSGPAAGRPLPASRPGGRDARAPREGPTPSIKRRFRVQCSAGRGREGGECDPGRPGRRAEEPAVAERTRARPRAPRRRAARADGRATPRRRRLSPSAAGRRSVRAPARRNGRRRRLPPPAGHRADERTVAPVDPSPLETCESARSRALPQRRRSVRALSRRNGRRRRLPPSAPGGAPCVRSLDATAGDDGCRHQRRAALRACALSTQRPVTTVVAISAGRRSVRALSRRNGRRRRLSPSAPGGAPCVRPLDATAGDDGCRPPAGRRCVAGTDAVLGTIGAMARAGLKDALLFGAAALGPLALYVATLPRTVVLEDDGLFLMAGASLGVAPRPLPPLHPRLPPVHAAPVRHPGGLGAPVDAVPGALACALVAVCARPARRLAVRGAGRGLAARRVGALLVAGDHRRGLHAERVAVLRRLRAPARRGAPPGHRTERAAREPRNGLAGARAQAPAPRPPPPPRPWSRSRP